MAREIANELESEELREFSEGGEGPSEADPVFEEKLRQKLWRMLRRRLARGAGEPEPLD